MNPTLEYKCPDCGQVMKRIEHTHSPTSSCYHSICENCNLEYCDFYRSYWGNKPKNPKAIKEEVLC